MTEQLTFDIDDPSGWIVQLRKGLAHGTELMRSSRAQSRDQVANLVDGFQTHASRSEGVTWNDDQDPVKTGFLGGLAPGGVVWEIRIKEEA